MKEFFKKIERFFKALLGHIKKGSPKVSEEIQKKRMSICEDCPFYNVKDNTCNDCGCYLPLKTKWADQECPQNKW